MPKNAVILVEFFSTAQAMSLFAETIHGIKFQQFININLLLLDSLLNVLVIEALVYSFDTCVKTTLRVLAVPLHDVLFRGKPIARGVMVTPVY